MEWVGLSANYIGAINKRSNSHPSLFTNIDDQIEDNDKEDWNLKDMFEDDEVLDMMGNYIGND